MKYRDFRASLSESLRAPQPDEIGVVEVREDLYDLIPEATLISVVRKHHPDTKITNTLIESYRKTVKGRSPTADKAVAELRKMNPADAVFEAHVEYRLDDGQVVIISEEMDSRLNKLLSEHPIVLPFINESADNFVYVISKLEE